LRVRNTAQTAPSANQTAAMATPMSSQDSHRTIECDRIVGGARGDRTEREGPHGHGNPHGEEQCAQPLEAVDHGGTNGDRTACPRASETVVRPLSGSCWVM
jgi:hypothetical protein